MDKEFCNPTEVEAKLDEIIALLKELLEVNYGLWQENKKNKEN